MAKGKLFAFVKGYRDSRKENRLVYAIPTVEICVSSALKASRKRTSATSVSIYGHDGPSET